MKLFRNRRSTEIPIKLKEKLDSIDMPNEIDWVTDSGAFALSPHESLEHVDAQIIRDRDRMVIALIA